MGQKHLEAFIKAHLSVCLSLLPSQDATAILESLKVERQPSQGSDRVESDEELRESLKSMKKLCEDIEGKLKKRKYVQTSLAFAPNTERLIADSQPVLSAEKWINQELARI